MLLHCSPLSKWLALSVAIELPIGISGIPESFDNTGFVRNDPCTGSHRRCLCRTIEGLPARPMWTSVGCRVSWAYPEIQKAVRRTGRPLRPGDIPSLLFE